jgi:hypothetical protein
VQAGTVEGAYMALFKGTIDVPPMFIDQLTHVVLRNVLDGTEDALRLRAAELFWREQKATIRDGHVLLADLETVEMHASGHRYGSIGRLIVEAQGELGAADLEVLDRANAGLYWERESKHDTVVSLTYGRAALDAFARVIELWIAHFLDVGTKVRPIQRIEEPRWAWHIGLDAEASAILNELWAGSEVDAGRMRNILALFSLQFEEPAAMRAELAGRAVYLALGSDNGVVRMKPQNLLLNLPLNEA